MDLGLRDRVFVLTGASRGLGFATAEALVADGAKVVISSRDKARVDEALAKLGGPEVAAGIAADLTDPATPELLIDLARQRFGRLDGALISVGGPGPGTAADVTDDDWRDTFETVFLGTVRATRTVAAALEAEGGAIALVLSSSVRAPIRGLGLSNGFRPGLAGVAKDMADQYGPHGVRIVSLMPGRLNTDRSRQFPATDPAAAGAGVPLGRAGEPAEFGKVAAFVLSPAASYLTGITIPVDGGALRSI